jgi:hypothetical protein
MQRSDISNGFLRCVMPLLFAPCFLRMSGSAELTGVSHFVVRGILQMRTESEVVIGRMVDLTDTQLNNKKIKKYTPEERKVVKTTGGEEKLMFGR